LSLENKGSSIKGRLAFNLKMRQKVKITIEPIKIQCDLGDLLKEASYNFSFRFIVFSFLFKKNKLKPFFFQSADGSDILHTEHSDVILNNYSLSGVVEKLEKEREHSQSVDEDFSKEDFTYESITEGDKRLKHFHNSKGDLREPTKLTKLKSSENFNSSNILKKTSSNMLFKKPENNFKEPDVLVNKHEIIWDYGNEAYTMKPIVDVDIGSNDFSQSCMQFFLWAPKEEYFKDMNLKKIKKEKIMDLKDLMKEEEDEKKEEEEESQKVKVVNNKLIGECYININKLFKDDIRAVNFLI